MTDVEKPIGMAIVVCDSVITDKTSNKNTLVGVFNQVNATGFPCVHPQMSVYVALTNAKGTVKVELACKNLQNDEEIVPRVGMNAQFPDPNHVVTAIFNLRGLPFNEPGVYAFEVYADGGFVLESRLNLIKIEDGLIG